MKRSIIKVLSKLSLLFIACCSLLSCEKYLDVKPDQKLAVPESLDDLQALIDNYPIHIFQSDALEVSAGEFTVIDANLASLSSDFHRRMYQWDSYNLFQEGTIVSDWARYYTTIYNCNTALEGLAKIERNNVNAAQYDQIKGRALFVRAEKLFHASLVWCLAYDKKNASNTLGMPIRLDTDFNKRSARSSLEDTYKQILADATLAVQLLVKQTGSPVEPNRCIANALLAKVYLYMADYENAFKYADAALALNNQLLDYSTLDATKPYPIPQFNKEVIYHCLAGYPQILNTTRAQIVEDLIASYEANDLRLDLYFTKNADGTNGFRGLYTGTTSLFMGIATDELYLIRAEAAVRLKRTDIALKDLNTLLVTRWKKENGKTTYQEIKDMGSEELLARILLERRKSLVFRGIRWYDLKRLNRDGANVVLKRKVEGKEFVLQPNDLRYALPIPNDIIELSDIVQNPR
ncbi:RagB/SusD family nutrient uptake outer membrane protein [Sphingobacterium sp. DR205]|uniref:RagB/SusD family nutrient uptake outer membrane protein n=1 Tax=Sphingobacterium sp. DR205 TaxID=2713573 RepID=UPI0013E4D57F|nr:RagB/SusD family nutrient uptake outer membrane protein [Sphingobacterium sp. DR205]QIH35498.1 RagB/SusD family nutrient uptake outer membrane protein [Sphingobacterium sp. DR205]